ncbi:unnamed protein product [Paramecium octaurelia]|uniref:Armadillo-type fold n=1 Tax=Paramecium octaurelia TaxID=43137 RepID=A0A8S1W6C7_PAROT|nr:unnamed protein product [Paramecium octaurelia]
MFQQEDNRVKAKRENYAVEIRNQSRLAIFHQKRNQFASQATLYKYVPENFLESIPEAEIQVFVTEKLLNPNNQLPYILEGLKILNEKRKQLKIYKLLQSKLLELITPFVGVLSTKEEYLSYLVYYHLLNIIYYLDQSQLVLFYNMTGFKELYYYIKDSTFDFVRAEKLEVAAFGLFTIANILSEKALVLKHPFITQQYQQFLMDLTILQQNIKINPTVNFIHGLMWVLRNLSQLSNNVYFQFFDILQMNITFIEKFQNNNNDISFQISQDFLQGLSTITRNMTEDEISELFATHIQLLIFLISNPWDPKVHLEQAEVIRNLLYGQDDVIEQLLSLGLSEVIMKLMSSNNQEVIEETIGCIRNIFGAEDEELITSFLNQQQLPLIKDLLYRCTGANKLEVRNEAFGAIQVLLTNFQESAEVVIKFGGIEILVNSLTDTVGQTEIINNILSSLHQLLSFDSSINLDQVKQLILNCSGEQIISQYLDSKDELTRTLAFKLIGFINLE